jgi:hypothetical protein
MTSTAAPVDRRPASPAGTGQVRLAVGLLTVGSFVPLGWLVGAVLLWSSALWTFREKVIGTLLVPGGLGALLLVTVLMPARTCVDGRCTGVGDSVPLPVTQAAVAVAALASIAVPVWLYRRALRRAGAR